jgi:ketosteroid isomerase-like protein
VTKTFLPALALSFATLAVAQDSPQQAVEELAQAIRKGGAKAGTAMFDPQASGLAEIRKNLEALSLLPDTNCAIAISRTTQSGETITFETDWSLQIYTVENGPLLDRHDHVTLSLRRIEKDWKIASLVPVSVLAPPDPAIFAAVARLVANLNDKNESDALGAFDKTMSRYGEIDNDIDALVTQNDILCGIDVVSDRQTGDAHTLDLDWYFELKSRTDGGPTEKRRERVQLKMRKNGRRWQIFSIEPFSILSPEIHP